MNELSMLVKLSDATRMLAECTSLDDVRTLRNMAEAARQYAKAQKLGHEASNYAMEIKLRADRRLGEMLRESLQHQGGRPLENGTDVVTVFDGEPLRQTLKNLGVTKKESSRSQTIASLPTDIFEEYLATKKISEEELTTADILRLAKLLKQEDHLATIRSVDTHTCASSDLNEIIRRGMTFGTLYADPPWSYGNQATRASTDNHYPTLTPEQIARDFAPQMRALSAPNAHLHLWTTNAFLFDSKAILEAWGFEYKSVFVWVKPQIGMGNYWRLAHEFLLLGIKGNCPFADKSIKSWLESPRGEHSDKPDEIRSLIEKVSPPAYFELFGRRPIHNWVVYGNEIDQSLFYQSVENSSTHVPKLPTMERDPITQLRLVQ